MDRKIPERWPTKRHFGRTCGSCRRQLSPKCYKSNGPFLFFFVFFFHSLHTLLLLRKRSVVFSFLLSVVTYWTQFQRLSRILSSSYHISGYVPVSFWFDGRESRCDRSKDASSAPGRLFKFKRAKLKKEKVLYRHDSIRNDVNNNRNNIWKCEIFCIVYTLPIHKYSGFFPMRYIACHILRPDIVRMWKRRKKKKKFSRISSTYNNPETAKSRSWCAFNQNRFPRRCASPSFAPLRERGGPFMIPHRHLARRPYTFSQSLRNVD